MNEAPFNLMGTTIKLLITGARGMLGSNLELVARQAEDIQLSTWTRINVDLMDSARVSSLMHQVKPNTVIHAAAKVGGIQANLDHPVEFLNENVVMDTNVIMSAFRAGVTNFVYIGSSCMYPRDYRQPLVEDDILAAPLEPSNEGYAIAKIAGSRLCQYLSLQYGVNFKTIVPSNLYGPGDNFDTASSHLIAACISKVHSAKMKNSQTIDVWGNGCARREFTYTPDLAEWLIRGLRDIEKWPAVLNVGSGIDYSVNDYYEMAMDAVGYRVALVHDLSKPAGMIQKLMDSTKARSTFSWNPKTSVQDGMSRTYASYQNREFFA